MKRFSETDKWKDEWFSSLTPTEKLVFLFLIDSCDNAGFFELNQRVNSFLIGISEQEYLGAIEGLNRGLLGAKNGKLFWIKKFLFHQKNLPLKIENNAHKQIIGIIQEKLGGFDDLSTFDNLGANQGLFSPIGKGKVEVKVGKGVQGENKKQPKSFFKDCELFDKIKFKEAFPDWSKDKLSYYYDSVLTWSNEGNKKIDWKATVRTWATRDEKQGKIKFNVVTSSSQHDGLL